MTKTIMAEKPSPELVAKAKEIVLVEYPDAFCQPINTKCTVGTYSRTEYIIERVISKKDEDGEEREQLSVVAFSEENAWIYAADRITKYDNYQLYKEN